MVLGFYRLIFNQTKKIMESWKMKLKGTSQEWRGKMKQAYADLTDDDLKYAEGQEDEWLGKITRKLGKTKEQVIEWIEKL